MPPSPDRELLTESAARRLLERAGQIDADSTTVDTLRAAAREAGIADAAFEAALAEMRSKVATPPAPAPASTRTLKRVIAGMVAAALLIGATMMVAIPGVVEKSQDNLYLDHEILVQCLPMREAGDIAQSLLRDQGNEIHMRQGSRMLRVRTTDAQFATLQSTLESARKSMASACETTPP